MGLHITQNGYNSILVTTMDLLSRDNFREAVKQRDNYKCVICGNTKEQLDAHHIMERRLFEDGGYYIFNGATLCTNCHLLAEQTRISCDEIRKAANITKIILPPHLYDDPEIKYDKWGNIILSSGNRIKGELFYDDSVQKILKEGNVLHLFSDLVKYSRTHHLPWSNSTKDDRTIKSLDKFIGQEVVVTLKCDGENSSLYRNYIHARSLEPAMGTDKSYLKGIHSRISHDIPEGYRICGENLYAEHTIHYKGLPSYFLVFSIWNNKNCCLSWDDTVEWCNLLELEMVPILYRGIWNEDLIRGLYHKEYDGNLMEGYVVRIADSFSYREFRQCVAKYVIPHFVDTSRHWKHKMLVPNELKDI